MKEIKNIFKNQKYFKHLSSFPELKCPYNSKFNHQQELEDVEYYYNNPSLPQKFLNKSHKSVKLIFKDYLKDNNLSFNWKKFKEMAKCVDKVVGFLKEKNGKIRPKKFLCKKNHNKYKNIKDMSSFAYPSGHTAMAYFIAIKIGEVYPNHENNLLNLAELIGLSRLENAVHYPSDISSGRLIGEYLGQNCEHVDDDNVNISKKDAKKAVSYLRKVAYNLYNINDEKECLKNYAEDINEYYKKTNKIEGYNVKDEYQSFLKFLFGYPIDQCSSQKEVLSFIKMLCFLCKKKKKNKINFTKHFLKNIHSFFNEKELEYNNKEDCFRNDNNTFKTSPDFKSIDRHIKYASNISNPYQKHMFFEWVHPFKDGNGRIGRLLLTADLDFNFSKSCDYFSSPNYFKTIQKFIKTNKLA